MKRIPPFFPALLFLWAVAFTARLSAEPPFLKEDWIYTYEPSHPTYWGVQWGLRSLMLPARAAQRAKHELEARYAGNWRFGSERGGAGGIALRTVSAGVDFGIFQGLVNYHHALGHDAAARELSRGYGLGAVPDRYTQVLPRIANGGELSQQERNTFGGGPDSQTQYMVQPMQAENQFAYESAKDILGRKETNSTEVGNFLFYRLRFLLDGLTETGTLDQDFVAYSTGTSSSRALRARFEGGRNQYSTDFTHYLIQLNTRRYGVQNVGDYKINMDDIKTAYYYQLLDPLFYAAFWRFVKDSIVDGKTRSKMPMLKITERISYFPAFRVYFSPFGIDYRIDNFFRTGKVLTNVYASVGDNRYEKRSGFGLEIENVALWRGIRIGVFGEYQRQPLLSRIMNNQPLSPQEIGDLHAVYNFGGSIKAPLFFWNPGEDPNSLFLYARGGQKNAGWLPGEYLKGSTYFQIGAGLRL